MSSETRVVYSLLFLIVTDNVRKKINLAFLLKDLFVKDKLFKVSEILALNISKLLEIRPVLKKILESSLILGSLFKPPNSFTEHPDF